MKVIVALLVCAVSVSGARATENLAFRGIQLGISKDEFRKLPFPDLEKWPKVRSACAGDKLKFGIASEPRLTKAMTDAGITFCKYYNPNRHDNGALDEWAPDFADIGNYDTTFNFLKTEENERLFQISIQANNRHYDRVISLLTQRYGKPEISSDIKINSAGARYENIKSNWIIGDGSIEVQKYSNKIDGMSIVYLYEPLIEVLAKRLIEKDKELSKKL